LRLMALCTTTAVTSRDKAKQRLIQVNLFLTVEDIVCLRHAVSTTAVSLADIQRSNLTAPLLAGVCLNSKSTHKLRDVCTIGHSNFQIHFEQLLNVCAARPVIRESCEFH